LRARQDVARLLLALFASAFIVALQGLVQYFLFRHTIAPDPDGVRRVHALFGSANNVGLFFDYSLPIGLALLISRHHEVFGFLKTWGVRIAIGIALLPMLLVLYLTQSGGAWVAIACATLFIVLLSLPNRRIFWLSCLGLLFVLLAGGFVLRHHIIDFLNRHLSVNGVSTFTKRLYLWESALRMIRDRPLFGFGLDNWLCFYSANSVCVNPAMNLHHYWVLYIPGTHTLTGLSDEPTLSHPHNIFLHVWVSMGIFGLLAFVAVLALFARLFTRILKTLQTIGGEMRDHLRWMTVGVGAAMLAGIIQGQVDSSFLAQDMAFCFWTLVGALLLLRVLSGTPWRKTGSTA
jgi:putative inorganic carbon (HCO3(-)) transporter